MANNLILPSEKPVVSPNVRAPLYDTSEEEQQALLAQAVAMLTSSTGFQSTEENRQFLRQTAMVNMFIALRYVFGYANAFNRLTPELHLDLCNFYQIAKEPGAKVGVFLPRGMYKSTIVTYGAATWDILCDPDHEEVLASNIIDRSLEFNAYVQEIFTKNDLVAWLFPEWVPESTHGQHWNARETRVRCKRTNKPNIKIAAVGGSIQGLHAPVFRVDDLIGEHMLDSARQLGADNEKASNWFRGAIRNIPRPVKQSRIVLCGTRYGPGDAYMHQWADIKQFYGYTLAEPFEEKEDGEWTIYYRAVREDYGKGPQPIFPEEYSNEMLDKIMEEDPWEYWTQLMNMSTYSGLSELIDYRVKECSLDVDERGKFVVGWFDEELKVPVSEPLENFDLIQAVDPAGSEKKKSVRTSKSAAVVLATHWSGKRFWLRVDSGYVQVTQMIDWMFDNYRRFRGNMRLSGLEMQGPFKILGPILRDEQMRRGEYINVRPVTAKGDKDGRIRANLQPLFDRGHMYATESARPHIIGEMSVFPDGHQKDVLDAMAIAVAKSYVPDSPEEDEDEELVEAYGVEGRNAVTGY